MPLSLNELEIGKKYIVTRVGDTEPIMTGNFVELIRENHPYGPSYNGRLPVAKIDNYADREVGYYGNNFTFELADPDNTAGNTPAGIGLNAARALRAAAEKKKEEEAAIAAAAAKLGGRRHRRTKKSKRRSRKTRRRHR